MFPSRRKPIVPTPSPGEERKSAILKVIREALDAAGYSKAQISFFSHDPNGFSISFLQAIRFTDVTKRQIGEIISQAFGDDVPTQYTGSHEAGENFLMNFSQSPILLAASKHAADESGVASRR